MIAQIAFPEISPEIFAFDLFGFNIALRWYAMGYIVGIALGWQILKRALNRDQIWPNGAPMPVAKLEDLLTYIVIGVIAGGRLGYVLFYKPAYFLANPIEIPQIWTGGMSFHGGFLGVIVAVYIFSLRHKVALAQLADGIALAAPIAIFLVRIANFINAELWGRETTVPWGVIFPTQAAQSCATAVGLCARHPSQLYPRRSGAGYCPCAAGIPLGRFEKAVVAHRGVLYRIRHCTIPSGVCPPARCAICVTG